MKRLPWSMLLFSLPAVATATTVDPTSASYDWIKIATSGLSANLSAIGLKLFFLLTLLQFTITLIGAVGNGEIDLAIGKVAKGFLWMFFCLFLMTNNHAYNFIANTTQYFLNNAISWTTSSAADFSANGVIAAGLAGYSNTVMAIQKTVMSSVPTSWSSILLGGGAVTVYSAVLSSITLGVIFLTILFCTAYIALKVFMIKIETALILSMLPFSLALLGLSALRDQGFAPFKSMLALIYRIIILGVVVGGMSKVGENLALFAGSEADPNIVQMALVSIFGYLLLAFIAFKADQIAAALASGSANLGSGDMVGAAIAGAAAGGAVAAALQGVSGAANTASQSMGDFMNKLAGEGSINNASQRGTGHLNEPSPAPTRAMASVPDSTGSDTSKTSSSSEAPRRNQAEAGVNTGPSQTAGESSKPAGAGDVDTQSPSGDSVSTSPQQDSQSTGGIHTAPSPTQVSNELGTQHGNIAADTTPASIGGAPQREIGKAVASPPTDAPKREKTAGEQLKQNLSKLAEQTQQERQATHVSINTHQHE